MCQGALESKKTGMGLLAARVRENLVAMDPVARGALLDQPKRSYKVRESNENVRLCGREMLR